MVEERNMVQRNGGTQAEMNASFIADAAEILGRGRPERLGERATDSLALMFENKLEAAGYRVVRTRGYDVYRVSDDDGGTKLPSCDQYCVLVRSPGLLGWRPASTHPTFAEAVEASERRGGEEKTVVCRLTLSATAIARLEQWT
jgi:hypothetical protein